MKTLLALAILLTCSTARSQTNYDFTISNDPALCPASLCQSLWQGSGSFSLGNSTVEMHNTLYPMENLTGTLNGFAITGAGFFYSQELPISEIEPLHLASSSNQWLITMTDLRHLGTGQIGYDLGANTSSPVSFKVTPSIPPVTFGNPAPTLPSLPTGTDPIPTPIAVSPPAPTPAQVAAFITHRAQMNIGLEVGVPLATAIVLYELHRHWPRHREALPAGRF